MADALEFYKNSTTTQGTSSSSTYSTHLTCSVDRSGEAATKDFIVIAHIATTVDTVAEKGKIRLYQDDATALGECASGVYHSNTAFGLTYNFVKKISLTAASHNIKLQFARIAGSANFNAENSSIIVLECTSDVEFAERTSLGRTDTDTGWVDCVTLTFTPATTQNYLFVWAGEFMHEDESDSGVGGERFINDTDTVIYQATDHGEFMHANNDIVWFTQGGSCYDSIEDSSHTFKIQIQGGGVNDEVLANNAGVVAIPFDQFETTYTDSQVQTKVTHTGTTLSDTNAALSSQSVNAADHLVIGGLSISNEAPASAGIGGLSSAGTTFTLETPSDRDEDSGEYWCMFGVHGVTLSASSYDFAVQGKSSSASGNAEGMSYDAYLFVGEIPAGTSGTVDVAPTSFEFTSKSPAGSGDGEAAHSPTTFQMSAKSPAASGSGSAAVAPITFQLSNRTPVGSGSGSAAVAPTTLNKSVQSPAGSGSGSAAATAQTFDFEVRTPVASGEQTDVPTITYQFSVRTPVASGSGSASASPITYDKTVQSPAGSGTGSAAMSPETAQLSVRSPAASGSGSASVAPITFELSAQTHVGSGTGSASATAKTFEFSVQTPVADAGAAISYVSPISLSFSVRTPAASGSGSAAVSPVTKQLSVRSPAASGSGSAAASPITKQFSVRSPSANGSGSPGVSPTSFSLTSRSPAGSGSGSASVSPITLTLVPVSPSVGGGFEEIPDSVREIVAVSGKNQIVIITGPIALTAGDEIQVVGKVSTYDTSSEWLADESTISLFKV